MLPTDEGLAPEGRVLEILSEHLCQGWLEGYLLTGRHGVFNCYEAFIHIVDSMFNQHAKWLKVTREIPWRRPIASLNYLLSSHVWRQDHNGFSHQDPGFIDHVVNKKAEIIRVYLPPDANTLLSVADHCLRSRHYVNVIVAGKQPALNYLSMDDAIVHCTRGLGIWEWASNDDEGEPDVVLACCGDVPTLETLAAAAILRERLPELKVRVVNVVDLMRLQPESGASARPLRHRVRLALHDGPADRLRVPRLPVADPPPHVPPRRTTRTSTCAATRRRARRRRRSTWSCSTTSTGSTSSWTSSTACPVSRRARHTCGRRWSTAGCRRARTRASTATTIPRSATGPGRSERVGAILVVNAGSTSLKLHLVSRRRERRSRRVARRSASAEDIDAVGHRVVHGGAHLVEPTRDRRRRARGDRASSRRSRRSTTRRRSRASTLRRRALPDVPHVAVFDTAFHATMPAEAATYALPRTWREEWGIRRYGFHGLSVQWCAERASELLDATGADLRLVVCHLGGGCSVTAVRDGRSVDTTMGFSPLEGVPMATRSGSVDPGALLYRPACARPVRRRARSRAERGVRARGPVRTEAATCGARGGGRGRRATRSSRSRVYTYRIAGAVAAMAAALGGLDAAGLHGRRRRALGARPSGRLRASRLSRRRAR